MSRAGVGSRLNHCPDCSLTLDLCYTMCIGVSLARNQWWRGNFLAEILPPEMPSDVTYYRAVDGRASHVRPFAVDPEE